MPTCAGRSAPRPSTRPRKARLGEPSPRRCPRGLGWSRQAQPGQGRDGSPPPPPARGPRYAEEGAAPRTSAGRCRRLHRLGSRLQGPPLHTARLLRPHTREGTPALSQPRAPRARLPPAQRSRPFSPGRSAPPCGCGGGAWGAGPHVTRIRKTNRSARWLPRRPRPQDAQPLHPAGAPLTRTHPGRWSQESPALSDSACG